MKLISGVACRIQLVSGRQHHGRLEIGHAGTVTIDSGADHPSARVWKILSRLRRIIRVKLVSGFDGPTFTQDRRVHLKALGGPTISKHTKRDSPSTVLLTFPD
jgi:hypothetical protein